MVAVRMKSRFSLIDFLAENAGLLTGSPRLRYCGMALKSLKFGLW
jgi:hypothetical protein